MSVYHESTTSTDTPRADYPYAYVVLPPIARLLMAICAQCGVGGTIRAGVRALAADVGYASAGAISPLLNQLADDGWILYDPATSLITLLRSPEEAITPTDQETIASTDQRAINEEDQPISAIDRGAIAPPDQEAITQGDRAFWHQNAEMEAIILSDRSAPRMEDHVLVAAADHELDSAAATREKLPCATDSIARSDRSQTAQALADLGAEPPIIRDALRARPDLTPEQVRAAWAKIEPRIKAGLCGKGAFFGAIREGRGIPAPTPELIPVNDADDEHAFHAAYHRARSLAPPGLSHAAMTELIYALLDGATDEQALGLIRAGGAP